MVVGPNEPYLKESLNEFKRLCDDAVIACNNTDEETERTIKSYGFWCYRDDREWGKHQPYIKTDLLKRISRLNPDVVLPLDADETFDQEFTRERLEEYARKYPAGYFYIVNLWNDEKHHRKSLGFWNIRMFNFRPDLGLEYQKKSLHCGLGPPWTYNYGSHVPFFVKHKGLMDPQARQRRVARYEKYDPAARFKDISYYNALKDKTDGSDFIEDEMRQRLAEEVATMGDQTKTIMQPKEKKFVYVRRLKDGQVLDIPEKNLFETLKQGFEFVGDVVINTPAPIEIPKADSFTCILCGQVCKTEKALKTHKTKKHS